LIATTKAGLPAHILFQALNEPFTFRKEKTVEYKVVPFRADIMAGEGESRAAQQLADLINQNAQEGWVYVRLETLATSVTTPADQGCFGFGATPASTTRTEVYAAVFSRETSN
jgi:hypothetical protein